jgi:hypothetical protein
LLVSTFSQVFPAPIGVLVDFVSLVQYGLAPAEFVIKGPAEGKFPSVFYVNRFLPSVLVLVIYSPAHWFHTARIPWYYPPATFPIACTYSYHRYTPWHAPLSLFTILPPGVGTGVSVSSTGIAQGSMITS